MVGKMFKKIRVTKETEEQLQAVAQISSDQNRYQEILEDKEKCIISTMSVVNDLLQHMTSLDYVREMIMDANAQAEMIQTVAASSEEMTAATEDISNYVQKSTDNMRTARGETDAPLDKVEKTFSSVEENISEIDGVKGIIAEVTEETVKINELVNVIKSVADQTNLLSLNASIEAARAGENGRDFAVVANEIKKLSESTKEQVDIIRKIVDGLNEKIEKASDEIGRVVNSFSDSKESINEATSGIFQISGMMSTVESSFTSISANVEEQTATTQEIAANIMAINEKSTLLKEKPHHTGQSFYDISQKIDEVRLNALAYASTKDQKTLIDLAVTDHLMWKWRIYNMILGYVKLYTDTVGNHSSCRLGKWIATLDLSDAKLKNIVRDMEKPHSEIHTGAKKAIEAYESGNIETAERLLKDIERNSGIVVNHLSELRKII
jgi:methyl-accepting chemotaxis protein